MKMPLLQEMSDTYVKICLEQADESSCSKMGYGALLVNDYNGLIMQMDHNHPHPETAWVCEPSCVRERIESRTNSMIGACFHAEEWVMAQAIREGIDLRNFVLFVAGVRGGVPMFRDNPAFSCIRCASQMVLHRLKGVYLFDGTYWHYQNSAHAYTSAYAYAVGERKFT